MFLAPAARLVVMVREGVIAKDDDQHGPSEDGLKVEPVLHVHGAVPELSPPCASACIRTASSMGVFAHHGKRGGEPCPPGAFDAAALSGPGPSAAHEGRGRRLLLEKSLFHGGNRGSNPLGTPIESIS